MHIHQIAEDSELLKQERHDPITGEKLRAGDEILFCAGCKSAFFKDTWAYLEGEHCGQNDTLPEFPKQGILKLTYEQIDVNSFELNEMLFNLGRNTSSPFEWKTFKKVKQFFIALKGTSWSQINHRFISLFKVNNLLKLLPTILVLASVTAASIFIGAEILFLPLLFLALLLLGGTFITFYIVLYLVGLFSIRILKDIFQFIHSRKTRFWSLYQNGIYMGGQRPYSYLPLRRSSWKLRFSDISVIRVWQEKRRTKLEVVLKDRRKQQIKVPQRSKKALFWVLKRVSAIVRVELSLQDRQDLSYVRMMKNRHGAEFDIVY
ncbi:MAG: hypothetical protein AAF740_15310 [Bacteroidota bacterium]